MSISFIKWLIKVCYKMCWGIFIMVCNGKNLVGCESILILEVSLLCWNC